MGGWWVASENCVSDGRVCEGASGRACEGLDHQELVWKKIFIVKRFALVKSPDYSHQ